MRKSINSATQKFEDQITEELVLDAVPTVNSFNGVTSDGVARAVAGASGAVPQVTESDNGKVLKAIYDAGGPAVEWGDAPSGVPEYSATDEGKVLGVITEGVEDTPALGWVEQQGGTVDQTYDATSTNAQSGVAVAGAIAGVNQVPASTSADENKVLTVNSSGSPVWAVAQGGGGMLPPIADNTVRCRFASGYTPSMGTDGNVCVDAANNIWDITDNTSFQSKFYQNTNLLEVLGARIVSVSSRDLSNMFRECSYLTHVANMELSSDNGTYSNYGAPYMFASCNNLTEVNLSSSDLADCSYMFYGCASLRRVEGLFLGYATDAPYMFSGCGSLERGYAGSYGALQNCSHMYESCTSMVFAAIEVSLWNCYDAAGMFYGCGALTIIPEISLDTSASPDKNVSEMFIYCRNAVSGIKKAYDVLVHAGATYTDCFTDCGINSYSGQQERTQIPAAWGGDAT